ncbi:MAG: zinc-binding dehydrogenase [Candidatus Eremiobacteraeota bacterium]|jgi:6-hydroxycyclohex-1-ene-1-carbonyl-CoA dehydrogenase|nr:zinc-binding dehydrogenase [Candidatus Eremiobacteraeota bacterium]
MKAAVFYGKNEPLKIEEVPVPDTAQDEILVQVAACGVCHTDLHYLDHGVPTFKTPPLILGHEASGIVSKCGSSVKEFKPGDRVLLPAVYACGRCFYCRKGRENICQSMIMLGNNVDGAYSEYVKIPSKDAFHLPEEIPLIEGAIIADAISTPFHAVKNRAKVQPGDTVAVFGCGGVGINVIQMAAAAGGTVIAVDRLPHKLELAKGFGAQYVIHSGEKDARKEIKKITNGGADTAIEAIGNPEVMTLAFESLRPGGRLCIIGYSDQNVLFSAAKIMYREMEIVGSLGCPPIEYPRVIEMVRSGKIKAAPLVTHRFPLSQIDKAFDLLRKGEGIRSVVIPGE